jgi:hypothetical protein
LAFGPRGAEGGLELLRTGELHAAPAAAGGGLDDDRIADLGRDLERGLHVGTPPSEPGTQGTPSFLRVLGGDLVAHDADMRGRGADEGDLVILDDLHEGWRSPTGSRSPDGSPARP